MSQQSHRALARTRASEQTRPLRQGGQAGSDPGAPPTVWLYSPACKVLYAAEGHRPTRAGIALERHGHRNDRTRRAHEARRGLLARKTSVLPPQSNPRAKRRSVVQAPRGPTTNRRHVAPTAAAQRLRRQRTDRRPATPAGQGAALPPDAAGLRGARSADRPRPARPPDGHMGGAASKSWAGPRLASTTSGEQPEATVAHLRLSRRHKRNGDRQRPINLPCTSWAGSGGLRFPGRWGAGNPSAGPDHRLR